MSQRATGPADSSSAAGSDERTASFPPAFRLYVLGLAVASAVFLPAGVAEALRLPQPWEMPLWIVFISAANLLAVPMLPRLNVDASLSAPVSVAAAVVLPPPTAVLVNAVCLASERELRRDVSLWMVLFNHGQMGLAGGAASLAAAAVDARAPLFASIVTAVLVYQTVNTAAITGALWLRRGVPLPTAIRRSADPFPRFALDFGLVTFLAVLIVIAHEQVGVWSVALMGLPLWLGYSALRSARESEDRAEQLAERVRQLEVLNVLGAELLAARRTDEVLDRGAAALRAALGGAEVEISRTGEVGALEVVKIPGQEPGVIGVPVGTSEAGLAVVEAVARLLGMTLTRMHLEEELAEVERARSVLSGRILEEGTRERSRIALQIHDEVLPSFAAAEIQADNVRSALAVDAEHAARLATSMRGAVHDGIAKLREVLDALQRQIIVPGTLQPRLQQALDDLKLRHGVQGRLDVPDELPDLPLAVEILVVETVRGCLANIARHAHARHAGVRLEVLPGAIGVEVWDDGRGFDPSTVPPGHHGLALMSQRVELARGRFHVDSVLGNGTRVLMEVPL